MFNSAVQLTFPCPACGGFLTLRAFKAVGPCPACGTQLEVNLQVQQASAAVLAADGDGGPPKKFEERRFRPSPMEP